MAVARRLASLVFGFLAITLITFALLNFAKPVIDAGLEAGPRADPAAKARAARLVERYALDRPMFFNPDPPDASRLMSPVAPPPDGARVGAWFAAARAESSGRGEEAARASRIEAERALAPSGRRLAEAMLPGLRKENALVLGMGLAFLHETAGIPDLGRPQGEPRRLLTPDEEKHNDRLRRSVALWWRRHQNEYRERSSLWRATWGKVAETRYGAWLGDLARLDFGDSLAIKGESPVRQLIAERLPVTLLVMLLATVVLFAVGVPLGLLAAADRGGVFDRLSQGLLFVLHATPEFWVATLALVYLCSEAHWHIFPAGGLLSPETATALDSGGLSVLSPRVLLDGAHHLVLPVLVLVLPAFAVVARHVRAAAIEVLGSRFVTAMRARGIPRRRILFVHVARNCAPAIVVLFTSVLPGLVTGSILIEYLFGLEGMGYLTWEAATNRDFPVGMAILTLVALVMLVAHVLGDALHAMIDPRVRRA